MEVNNSARIIAQVPTAPAPINLTSARPTKFSDESPVQQAQHLEIERRYRQPKRRGSKPARFPNLRKRELERLIADRCGGKILPDDDEGRDYLHVMTDHLIQLGDHHVAGWARSWAPWITDDVLDNLIEDIGPGKYWTASALGKELNLDDATRTRLKIKTIRAVDCSQAQRAERKKAQDAAAARDRRAKAGAKPHATSAARLKPWLALGISERTWRRRRATDGVGSNSSAILLESLLTTKRGQGAPPPSRGGSLARAATVSIAGHDGAS
jgi:hypothetical protein